MAAASVLGCSGLGLGPEPAVPEHGPSVLDGRLDAFARACECSAERAAEHVGHAAASFEARQEPRALFRMPSCASELTDIPATPRPVPALAADEPWAAKPVEELFGRLKKRRVSLAVELEADGGLMVEHDVQERLAELLIDRSSGGKSAPATLKQSKEIYKDGRAARELEDRLAPLGDAFTQAHLASQSCHAVALALELTTQAARAHGKARVSRERVHAAVERVMASARRSDALAAASTVLVLATRAVGAGRAAPGFATEVARRARRADVGGSFSSDVDRVRSRAQVLLELDAPALAQWMDDDFDSELRAGARPLTVSSHPALTSLTRRPRPRANRVLNAIRGVLRRDLGAVTVAGAGLAAEDSPERHGQSAVTRAVRGDAPQALTAAGEMAPGYGDIGQLIAAARKALRAKRARLPACDGCKGAEPPALPSSRPPSLTPVEIERLDAGVRVTHPRTFHWRGNKYVGGLSFQLVRAEPAFVLDAIFSTEAALSWMPMTESVRTVGGSGRDLFVEFRQGVDPVVRTYTVNVWRDDTAIRWRLDPDRPHDIQDTWGFMSAQPWGEGRSLVTVGVALDLGNGMIRGFFEEEIQDTILSTADDIRGYVEARSPGLVRPHFVHDVDDVHETRLW